MSINTDGCSSSRSPVFFLAPESAEVQRRLADTTKGIGLSCGRYDLKSTHSSKYGHASWYVPGNARGTASVRYFHMFNQDGPVAIRPTPIIIVSILPSLWWNPMLFGCRCIRGASPMGSLYRFNTVQRHNNVSYSRKSIKWHSGSLHRPYRRQQTHVRERHIFTNTIRFIAVFGHALVTSQPSLNPEAIPFTFSRDSCCFSDSAWGVLTVPSTHSGCGQGWISEGMVFIKQRRVARPCGSRFGGRKILRAFDGGDLSSRYSNAASDWHIMVVLLTSWLKQDFS